MARASKKAAASALKGHDRITITDEFMQALYVASGGQSFRAMTLDTNHRAFRKVEVRGGRELGRDMILARVNAAAKLGTRLSASGSGKGCTYEWTDVDPAWTAALQAEAARSERASDAARRAVQTRRGGGGGGDGGTGGTDPEDGAAAETAQPSRQRRRKRSAPPEPQDASENPLREETAALTDAVQQATTAKFAFATAVKARVLNFMGGLLKDVRKADRELAAEIEYRVYADLASGAGGRWTPPEDAVRRALNGQ